MIEESELTNVRLKAASKNLQTIGISLKKPFCSCVSIGSSTTVIGARVGGVTSTVGSVIAGDVAGLAEDINGTKEGKSTGTGARTGCAGSTDVGTLVGAPNVGNFTGTGAVEGCAGRTVGAKTGNLIGPLNKGCWVGATF